MINKETVETFIAEAESHSNSELDAELLVSQALQLFYVPLAVEKSLATLESILSVWYDGHLLVNLLSCCFFFSEEKHIDMLSDVLVRLVVPEHSSASFMEQFWDLLKSNSESLRSLKFLLSSQRSPSVISNALSLLCYTIREVPFALDTCGNILTDGDTIDIFNLLAHQDHTVRARCCSLLGNLVADSDQFYAGLKRLKVIPALIHCLGDSVHSVRAVSDLNCWLQLMLACY
jgi:hypothetical protein